jgi:hypothetical protein
MGFASAGKTVKCGSIRHSFLFPIYTKKGII